MNGQPAYPREVRLEDAFLVECRQCRCLFDPDDPDLLWLHSHRPFGAGTVWHRLRLWLRRRETRALAVDAAFTVGWVGVIELQRWFGLGFWPALFNAFVLMRPFRTGIARRWGI